MAEYSSGNGLLQFWGSHLTEEINNHGSQKTDELYIGVEQGVLGTGDYVIVFGKNMCGNNQNKQYGKDIKFQFTVAGTPELDEMIATAREFVKNVEDQGKIGDDPEQYSQAEVDTIKAAIEAAVTVQSNAEATDEDREAAADTLYKALEAFQDSVNFSVEITEISGIPDQVNVGDTGTAAAKVTARPDSAQYKRVSWSAVKYTEGDPPSGPEEDVPADNLTISATSGSWVAGYSGIVWVKAVSLKDPQECLYQKVEIQAEDGVLAVNLSDADMTLREQVELSLIHI